MAEIIATALKKKNKYCEYINQLLLIVQFRFILFKSQHLGSLTFRYINTFILFLYQHIFGVHKTTAFIFTWHNSRCKENCFLRTSRFAIAAINTTKHVYLVTRSIFFFAVKMLLTRSPLCSYHGYSLGRAGNRAQTTGSATFATGFITFQNMLSPVIIPL